MTVSDLQLPAVTPTATIDWASIPSPAFVLDESRLRRNLVYTAITRGKKLVVVVGQAKALALAVKGSQTRRRWSKIGE